ncbi:hypothetical protein WJX75_005379 [Coccomyxa subellipsoidea]
MQSSSTGGHRVIVHILIKGREDSKLKQVCKMESGQVNIKLLGQEKGVRVQKLAATLQDQQPNESEFFDVEWTSSGVQTIPSINNMPAEHVWLNCSREGAPWYIKLLIGPQRHAEPAH